MSPTASVTMSAATLSELQGMPDAVGSFVERVRRVVPRGTGTVQLHEPEFAATEWDYVKSCIDTGWVSSVGSFVDRFERDLAELCGTRHAVAVVNGTAALQIALLVAGVG